MASWFGLQISSSEIWQKRDVKKSHMDGKIIIDIKCENFCIGFNGLWIPSSVEEEMNNK